MRGWWEKTKACVRAAGVLVEPATDPGLLIGDGVAVGVTGGVDSACWALPMVDDDETGVAAGRVVEGVAHAVEVGADRQVGLLKLVAPKVLLSPRVCGKLLWNAGIAKLFGVGLA